MARDTSQKRLALAQKIAAEVLKGAEKIIACDDENMLFEEICDVILILIMSMPRKYRTGFLYAMTQIWHDEVAHDPSLRQAIVASAKKESLQ